MPKISVIVPVYNASRYLSECLDSLLNQTLKDIEIIAIDDKSTDNSLEILKRYAKEYPEIKVYCNKQNYGQSITRNLGLDIAKGDYIGFVDSDDVVEPIMYETMYNGAKDNNYPDVISVGISFVNPESKIETSKIDKARFKGNLINTSKNPYQVFWESPSCCSKLFKKELIGNYRFLENTTWEDVAFTYSMLMKANNILNYADNLYIYRRDVKNGVSSKGYNVNAPLDDIFKVADEIERQAIINKKYDIFKEVIPLIQEGVCFQRLKEINFWDEPEEIKNKTMIDLYNKTVEKYGDEQNLDNGLLSSKADYSLIEEVREMSKPHKIR